MNIVVLGAGTVGTSIADMLCRLENNVTVVDVDASRARAINDNLDVRCITGSASRSSVLFQAGISSADVCMAVTGNDEVNLVAASLAKSMGARRSIARVYAPVFRDLSTFDYQRHFQIDRLLSLEHLTAMKLARGIRHPDSVVVEQFTRSGLEVQEIVVGKENKVTKVPIRDLGLQPNVRIGTIYREKRMWIASADDQLQVGDRLTVFSRTQDLKSVEALFKNAPSSNRRVVIAGGGETGLHLARTLEHEGYAVKILESDQARCHELASRLDSTSVVLCDATHREVLEEERVGGADVFVACTGDDEDNIMLGVEAKDVGAKKIMAIVGRADYAKVIDKLGIDLAVSEREVMAEQLLAYLTDGAVISRAKLPGGLVNVVEVEVVAGSPATSANLAELGLPERCLVVAVIQQDIARVPGAKDKLQAGDTAVLLMEDDVVDSALALF